jgi:hypothetical protein
LVIISMIILPPFVSGGGGDGPAGSFLADELTRFTDVTEEAGFPDDLGRTRVAWGDYNGDGWEDLLLDGRMLWRNNGGTGSFSDVTSQAGIRGVPGVGGVWADYDNDGDLDFYTIVRSFTQRDALWRNDGDGTFTDVTMQAGDVHDDLPSEGAAWADYNDDGYVDLYVANYETASVRSDDELGIGTPDVLYKNNGDGTFSNVSRIAGVELDRDELCGRGVAWCDYDDDGDIDIYVSNYRLDPNLLWRNDGEGGFTNVAQNARVEGYASDTVPGGDARYGHTIGSDFGDYDNDGDMDLYASNLAHPRFIMFSDKSMLLNNRGDGTFVDRWYGSGIAYCETSSDSSWADYDNDGDLDLYFTAVYEDVYSRLFRNAGRERFEDATGESRTTVNNGWGIGWCDYDHDGDLDLAIGSGSGMRLFENEGNDNNWLQVELEGEYSNSKAIGARVRVSAGSLDMIRDVKGGKGTTTQDMLATHFGLGGHDGNVDVEVRWPGSTSWTDQGSYSVNQRIMISQGDADVDASIALEATPDEPRLGETVDLTAIVENLGETTIETVTLSFTVQGTGQIGTSKQVGPLDPGEDASASVPWQPQGEGSFSIIAQITDVEPFDANPDNDVARVTVNVRGTNAVPIARLAVEPVKAPPGVAINFDGTGSTDDIAIARYMFEFGDDSVPTWQTSPVTVHEYTVEGDYLASLTVEDGDGAMSTNFATTTVTITSRGFRPTAEIVTILPNPARLGETVTIHGRGTAVEGATITTHSWNSSIDGHIGDRNIVTLADLSLGEHTLLYKVQDDRGLWSDPATAVLHIIEPQGTFALRVDRPREGESVAGDTLTVMGTAVYSTGAVVSVEVRLDNDIWDVAEGTGTWTHELDLLDVQEGVHTIRVRALSMDSTSDIVFLNFTIGKETADPDRGLLDLVFTREGFIAIAVFLIVADLIYLAVKRSRGRAGVRI